MGGREVIINFQASKQIPTYGTAQLKLDTCTHILFKTRKFHACQPQVHCKCTIN